MRFRRHVLWILEYFTKTIKENMWCWMTFAWQTFASLRLFTCLVYVSTYCVPIALLRQNKPFPLLYLGHAQIKSHARKKFLRKKLCTRWASSSFMKPELQFCESAQPRALLQSLCIPRGKSLCTSLWIHVLICFFLLREQDIHLL